MASSGVGFDDALPPDDSGRDVFERFRYQAHIAFRDCLNCAAGQGVDAVVCEHFEDLCIEDSERIRFRQIKTRNPDYGLWRLADLCSESGALRSLLRCHRSLSSVDEDRSFIYEAALEGVLDRGDQICQFPPKGDGPDDALARRVIKHMKPHTELRLGEAREFLDRVRVQPSPQRDSIVALNKELLASVGGSLPAAELAAIYDRVIELICQAMSGTRMPNWPAILFVDDAGDDPRRLLEAKRLDQAALREQFEPAISGTSPSLREISDPSLLSASALEQKLRLAGAPTQLINRAKQLRANATYREIELRSRSLRPDLDAKLADLRERLRTAADVSLSLKGNEVDPAPEVFSDLLERLGARPQTFDPGGLYHQDPALLIGGVCDLSDQCLIAWRRND